MFTVTMIWQDGSPMEERTFTESIPAFRSALSMAGDYMTDSPFHGCAGVAIHCGDNPLPLRYITFMEILGN